MKTITKHNKLQIKLNMIVYLVRDLDTFNLFSTVLCKPYNPNCPQKVFHLIFLIKIIFKGSLTIVLKMLFIPILRQCLIKVSVVVSIKSISCLIF